MTTGRHIPYLSEQTIERCAEKLLADYERACGTTLEPPIPIEDIVEKHLKLPFGFADLHARFGVRRPANGNATILGAILEDPEQDPARRHAIVLIDESLDPDVYPAREGSYRMTLAHEGGGHWGLHQILFRYQAEQAEWFGTEPWPAFLLRSSENNARVEDQANFFASCLLMPADMVFAAWHDFFPDRKQQLEVSRSKGRALKRFCKPLAERFGVSRITMCKRLDELGLLDCAVRLRPPLSRWHYPPYQDL